MFYISGVIGIIWAMVFLWVGASTPDDHQGIGEEEKQKIRKSLQTQVNNEVSTRLKIKDYCEFSLR